MSRLAAAAAIALSLVAGGCEEKPKRKRREPDDAAERGRAQPREPEPDAVDPGPGPPRAGGDLAAFVYLVTKDRRLFRFDPRQKGLAAYGLVGRLDCKSAGEPQSMAVDRSGTAWVFYDSRELFRVSTADASCSSTAYKHPSTEYRLGMAFTAAEPGSSAEVLFVDSPDFGLATVATPSFAVHKLKPASRTAELTGGIDARLFLFESTGVLSELDRATYERRPMHTFTGLGEVTALAFARYAGLFYVFTANGGRPSRAAVYDPRTKEEFVRDPALGFVVVGAGQSTKVPPTDGGFDVDAR